MPKKTKSTKLPYVILRGYRSGIHAGELAERNRHGNYVLRNARRIWRFNGAQTLSEVAVYGLSSESRVAPSRATWCFAWSVADPRAGYESSRKQLALGNRRDQCRIC